MFEAQLLIRCGWKNVKIVNIQHLENNVDYEYRVIFINEFNEIDDINIESLSEIIVL